jgi:hypothetical protein
MATATMTAGLEMRIMEKNARKLSTHREYASLWSAENHTQAELRKSEKRRNGTIQLRETHSGAPDLTQ